MIEQEIRARALEAAVRCFNRGGPYTMPQLPGTVSAFIPGYMPSETVEVTVRLADLFATYIRLGMEGVEGMLKEAPK